MAHATNVLASNLLAVFLSPPVSLSMFGFQASHRQDRGAEKTLPSERTRIAFRSPAAVSDETSIELATLRFEGERFLGHALDVECTHELVVYRSIVLECAKELWRRKHPDRVRLPRGFEEGFRLEFDRVEDGSAIIPLRRMREREQASLDWGNLDEFDEAAQLVDAAISAASADRLLPDSLPTNVVPLFRELGKTLQPQETLFTQARHSHSEARYDAAARRRLGEWLDVTYEDLVDVVGEVRMAHVGPGTFSLLLEDGVTLVPGRFAGEQEDVVLDALRNHRNVRLRVRGVTEFGTYDRALKRFTRVDDVAPPSAAGAQFDSSATPIWEQLSEIGGAAPRGTWDDVPTDLSKRDDGDSDLTPEERERTRTGVSPIAPRST
jgi:hypothetical protein